MPSSLVTSCVFNDHIPASNQLGLLGLASAISAARRRGVPLIPSSPCLLAKPAAITLGSTALRALLYEQTVLHCTHIGTPHRRISVTHGLPTAAVCLATATHFATTYAVQQRAVLAVHSSVINQAPSYLHPAVLLPGGFSDLARSAYSCGPPPGQLAMRAACSPT
jgi:hypothetical protein